MIKPNDIVKLKGQRKITMLTAYDFPTATIIDRAGIDMILVGDSLANVVLGLNSTRQVGMGEMLHHCKAVTRAVKQSLVVADMPYDAYQTHPGESVKNASRFIEEARCGAVKLEWFDRCLEVTEKIVKENISVIGHIGLTPQTADQIGGFKVQGKDADTARRLLAQARELEKSGCFAIVIECVPDKLATIISSKLNIPTIGCGAGAGCDGQVLVIHDILGLFEGPKPKFVKQYVNLSPEIQKAVENYRKEVIECRFPDTEHSYTMKEEELRQLE
jgi:3-methyl-2-oxobutanoate hydroxymethyltransferase